MWEVIIRFEPGLLLDITPGANFAVIFAFALSLGVLAGAFYNALRFRVRSLNRLLAVMFAGRATRLVWEQ